MWSKLADSRALEEQSLKACVDHYPPPSLPKTAARGSRCSTLHAHTGVIKVSRLKKGYIERFIKRAGRLRRRRRRSKPSSPD